jgi:hypothetical protein
MIRRLTLAAAMLLLAVPLAAQAPAGLKYRLDRSLEPSDPDNAPDVKLSAIPNGFRVTTGPAAVIYNPANTATGDFTLSGTFTFEQLTPNQANGNPHLNFIGLVLGGGDLQTSTQNYVYFLVDWTGRFLIKHRAKDAATRAEDAQAVHTVVAPTAHAAIKKSENGGPVSNDLEVRVRGNEIQFVVNGQVVHTASKTGMTAKTDGIYGVRINHVVPAATVTNLKMTTGSR